MNLCPKHYTQMRLNGEIRDDKKSYRYDLTNKRFDKLVVKEYVGNSLWKCECDCGGIKNCLTNSLLSGYNTTCGECSYNTYEFIEDYVKIYSTNGLYFYIDYDDYERVAKFTWRVDTKTKRVFATINNKTISLHKFLTNTNKSQHVDHIDGNPSNNRKNNLRYCTIQENAFNSKLHTNNTSGVTGVWYDNKNESWVAEIKINQEKTAKRCSSFISAVIQRLKWEVKLFGEFRSFRNDKHIEEVLNKYGYKLNDFLNKEE